jgi:hypothetical protein
MPREGAPESVALGWRIVVAGVLVVLFLALMPADWSLADGSIQGTEGAAFSGLLFTASCRAFSATINWGDGSSSAGTTPSGGAIDGSHTYAEEGTYSGSISYSDDCGTGTTSFQAVIGDAQLSASPTGMAANAGAAFNGTVGSLSDADPGGSPGDYTATINWGDGTGSAGSVATGAGRAFSVNGSHTYATPGSYTVEVAIGDVGGASVHVREQANVGPALTAAFSASPASVAAGQPVVLDASGSRGPSLRYRWDLDGSGRFATDGGANSSLQTNFLTPGRHPVALRVTDPAGATATTSHVISVQSGPEYSLTIAPANPAPGQPVHFRVRLLKAGGASRDRGPPAAAATAPLPSGTLAGMSFGGSGSTLYGYRGKYRLRGTQLSSDGSFTHSFTKRGVHVLSLVLTDRTGASSAIGVAFGFAGRRARSAACCGGPIQAVALTATGEIAGQFTRFDADVYPPTAPTGHATDIQRGLSTITLNFGGPISLHAPPQICLGSAGDRARISGNPLPGPGTQHDVITWNFGDPGANNLCDPNTGSGTPVFHTYHSEGIYSVTALVERHDFTQGDQVISRQQATLDVPMITPVCGRPLGVFRSGAFGGYLVESDDGCFYPATQLGFAPGGGWEAYETAQGVGATVDGLDLHVPNGPLDHLIVDPHTGFIGDSRAVSADGALCGALQTRALGPQVLRCNRDATITLTRGGTELDGFEGPPQVDGLPRNAPPHVRLSGSTLVDPSHPASTVLFHVRLPAPIGTSIDVNNLGAGEADSDFTLDGDGNLLPTGTPSGSGLGANAANFQVGPLPPVPFGPLILSNFSLTHEDNPPAGFPAWHGGGDVTFLPGGPTLSARDDVFAQTGIGITGGGGLDYAGAKVDPLPLPIPIPPFFRLQGIGANFGPSPFHIQATAHVVDDTGALVDLRGCLAFVVGQRTGNGFPFCDRGTVVDNFDDVRARLSGHVTIADFLPIDASLEYDQDPFQVHLEGHFHKDFSPVPVALDADVRGDFYASPFRFFLGAQGRIEQSVICFTFFCPDIGSASGAVSSRGAELCGSIAGLDLGGYVLWSPFSVGLFFDCSEGFSKVSIAQDAAVAAGGAAASFTIARGQPRVTVEVRGSGGPPRLTLTAPDGRRSVDPGVNHLAGGDSVDFIEAPKLATTFVVIRHPRAGHYTLASSGAPIVSATVHNTGAAVSIAAHVSGAGGGGVRTLHYRIRNLLPGTRVTFAGIRPNHVLGVARGASGSLRFRPAAGPAGRRTIVAELERSGLPMRTLVVGSYTASAPPPLPAVRALTLRFDHGSVVIRWRRAAGAVRYRVLVRTGGAAGVVRSVSGRASGLRVTGLGSPAVISVTVATIGGPAQRAGSASARIRTRTRRVVVLL